MSNKVTYKNYNMNQLQIPMDITDWIEENHIIGCILNPGHRKKILTPDYNLYMQKNKYFTLSLLISRVS